MKRLLRPLLLTAEALLLVVGLWMALLQVTWLWVHMAPDQVRTWLSWVTGERVQVARIKLPHTLLLPKVELHDLKVQWDDFSFQAQRLILQVQPERHGLRTHLSASQWQLRIKPASGLSQSPDLNLLQHRLSLAFPRWPLPLDMLTLESGVVHYGEWQVVIPTMQIARKNLAVSGQSQLSVVYDRVVVWQGAWALIAQLDWRQRVISGTWDWHMSRPTQLVDLAPLLQTRWRKGALQLNGALRYQQGRPNLSIQLRLEQLNILAPAEAIQSLGAVLAWREQQGQRAFVIEQWMINDKVLLNQAPAMVVLAENQLSFFLPHLSLDSFKPALQVLWPQWDWQKTHFNVDHVQLRYQLKPLRLQAATGRVHALAWPARKNWPGLMLRDLQIAGTNDRLVFTLKQPVALHWAAWTAKQKARLSLPQSIELRRVGSGWRLQPLAFQLDDMAGRLQWEGNGQAGKLSLVLQPETLQRVKRFLPYGLMDPKLSQWLQQALVKGKVEPVRLDYQGPWAEMLQADSPFAVETALSNGVLRFQPDWPALEQMQARLRFKPFRLNIDLSHARMKGVQVKGAQAQIGPLNGGRALLKVSGQARGRADQVEALILDSPLLYALGMEGVLGQSLRFAGGQVAATVQLHIPLHGKGSGVAADVRAQLRGVQAYLPGGITPKALSGQVDIQDLTQIRGRLQGVLFGKPLAVNITSTDQGRLRFDLSAQVPLSEYLADTAGWLKLNGQIQVPLEKAKGVQFHASARAQLDKNHLPAPLNELMQQPLSIKGRWEGGHLHAAFSAGHALWAQGRWQQGDSQLRMQQAVVLIGESPYVIRQFKRFPPQQVTLSIAAQELDLGHWLAWWSKQRQKLPMITTDQGLPPMQVALRAASAHYGGQRFDQLALTGFTLDTQRLALHLRAKQAEMVGILLPDTHQLVLSARRLLLRQPDRMQPTSCSPWQRPQDFKVFFVGQNVHLDRYHFDRLRFNLYGDPAQIRVEGIKAQAEAESVTFSGQLLWRFQENSSRLAAQFESKDVKRFLKWAGFKKPGFTGEHAVVDAQITWPGPPDCITLKNMEGEVSFRLDDGVIEQAQPGLAKVFALLSVDSLMRSIQATLGTLQYKGMVYSKIAGEIRLRRGWGHVKHMVLDAPALQAELKGGVDLMRRRFDLKAKVIPQIGGTLTTLLSMFGLANPLTAIGTYLFLKNVPGANPNLISYHYRIMGPWDEPRIINTDTGEVIGRQPSVVPQSEPVESVLEQ